MTAVEVNSQRIAFALCMSLPFHVVLSVVNDLADIEVDRGDPRKAGRPLVSGRISPRTALGVVVSAVVLGFLADPVLLGLDAYRFLALFISFAATAAYNVAGKRTVVPPFMDFLQGVGAAGFAYYGALVAGDPTSRSALLAISVVVFITFINGVHAGLRDLSSDYSYGARTTPILFGARPTGADAPHIPRGLVGYAWALQILLSVITLGPFLATFVKGALSWTTAIVAAAFGIASFASLFLSLNSRADMGRRYVFAGVQLLTGFGTVALCAGGRSGDLAAVAVFLLVLLPLTARRLKRRMGAGYRRLAHG
ncbi:UbiA prenyltransferase family protein [Streptomyces sp. NPDC057238]|uniref:UbiA prenyltransferase family protein n=1 Tax=Streptomyces sp. NPDC057238 TaxID=3346060 RepID=UPI00363A784C